MTLSLGRVARRAVCLAALCGLSVAAPAQAFDQNGVIALLQSYQQLCGRVIAAPEAFHQDPGSNFGLTGEVEFAYTEDRASVDYIVITPSPVTPGAEREYGLVSNKNGSLVEQSCFLGESSERAMPLSAIAQLANTLQSMISATDGFTISGGAMVRSLEAEPNTTHVFTITGMFVGEDILTLVTLHPQFVSIEHTHISTLN